MSYVNPTVTDFKNQFVRDFPYGQDPNTSVIDADITAALNVSAINVNPALWADQASYSYGYLLLTAHFMVMSLRSSSQGINGQFNFLQQSKNAASVVESFGIPQRILDNPLWSMYCKTNYGAQYLQLVLPQLLGNVFSVHGSTRP